MISYRPFWETLERSGETQYSLIHKRGVSPSAINRLKHNKNLQMETIDKLCHILNCQVEDIMEHIPDESGIDWEKTIKRTKPKKDK